MPIMLPTGAFGFARDRCDSDDDRSPVSSASEADACNSAVWIADVRYARRQLGRILVLIDVHELPGLLQRLNEQPLLFVLLGLRLGSLGCHCALSIGAPLVSQFTMSTLPKLQDLD
jgi:hypothetical protein